MSLAKYSLALNECFRQCVKNERVIVTDWSSLPLRYTTRHSHLALWYGNGPGCRAIYTALSAGSFMLVTCRTRRTNLTNDNTWCVCGHKLGRDVLLVLCCVKDGAARCQPLSDTWEITLWRVSVWRKMKHYFLNISAVLFLSKCKRPLEYHRHIKDRNWDHLTIFLISHTVVLNDSGPR